eukprot:UN13583
MVRIGPVFLASVCAVPLLQPFDFVSTRLMNQPLKNGVPLYYRGVKECVTITLKEEGVKAFGKG